jgi:hypothetical protein
MVRVTESTFPDPHEPVELRALLGAGADRLHDEEPGDPAATHGVQGVLDRDVVVDGEHLDLDVLGLGHARGLDEITDPLVVQLGRGGGLAVRVADRRRETVHLGALDEVHGDLEALQHRGLMGADAVLDALDALDQPPGSFVGPGAHDPASCQPVLDRQAATAWQASQSSTSSSPEPRAPDPGMVEQGRSTRTAPDRVLRRRPRSAATDLSHGPDE